jgi:stage V sporulation protein SpoVS
LASQQALSHTTEASSCHISSTTTTPCSSTTSLARSDSELALLLNGADLSRPGTTTINIGSIPIQVPLAVVDVPAADVSAAQPAAVTAAEQPEDAAAAAAAASSKLKATSAEFYPQAYLAAAAATAIAAQTLSSSNAAAADQQQQAQAAVAADVDAAIPDQQQDAAQAYTADQQQQQLLEANPQQQQYWQHWQQQWPQQHWQQQQQMPMAVHMFFPVPVPVPPYIMPAYPFAYQQMQQMHMQPVMLPHPQQQQQQQAGSVPAAAEDTSSSSTVPATPANSSSGYVPLSPAPSLPADTSSLMSTPRGLSGWALAHSSTRPGSSASSVVSSFSSARGSRHQQQVLRDAGTVTVSAMSCVKDAAGALAKVVSRHGSCLLLSLTRAGDQAAQATHVAAKSLAVARFYVNAHMAAAGAAGIDAAAVLTGVEPSTPAAAAAADEEVVFMPFNRNAVAAGSSSAAAAADAEPALGFIVAKAGAKDLPIALPPPVGIPACMQDRQQQQQHDRSSTSGSSSSSVAAPAAAAAAAVSAAPLLKAGASTDVNKLSNAIIHNVLGCNHVALQLAGAAACHVAMKALIKARARLQRKFGADIVATASFANEDTSSSIGRSTVFLRLDVMRSNLLQQLASGMAGQQQQQQFAGAV